MTASNMRPIFPASGNAIRKWFIGLDLRISSSNRVMMPRVPSEAANQSSGGSVSRVSRRISPVGSTASTARTWESRLPYFMLPMP